MANKKLSLLSPSKSRITKRPRMYEAVSEVTMAIKKTFLIGNGADDNYTVSHNLNSRNVVVQVRENFGDYSLIHAGVTHDSENALTIDMGEIINTDSYLVIVVG